MAKTRTRYECTACAAVVPKWEGRCSNCGAWDTLVERTVAAAEKVSGKISHRVSRAGEPGGAVSLADIVAAGGDDSPRLMSGIGELDGILGGGLVPGSLLLLGGDPGIGKSTLMLQMAAALAGAGRKVLYLSGEESASQIGMRARRLEISGDGELQLITETCFETVERRIEAAAPDVLIVDSIQTIYLSALDSVPGSVAQVRETAAGFMRLAKTGGITVILVGHVTKDGAIAGPRLLEHMVDVVLYFEGEGSHAHRILRVVKNRFGSTNEIGLFRMGERGLEEVADLSGYFLEGRSAGAPGSAVVCTVEGTRALLVEVQALVTPTGYGTAQRVSTGYDGRRLALMLAILEKRLGLPVSSHDVFVNVAGGLRLVEPAADLGVCLGVFSALRDKPLDPKAVFAGEVGLGGELRAVGHMRRRMTEAAKLGFGRLVCPPLRAEDAVGDGRIGVSACDRLAEAVRAGIVPENQLRA